MYIYWIINILIITVGVLIPEKIKLIISNIARKTIPIQMWLLFVILFVFLGFRGDFTSDYNNYSDYFEQVIVNLSFTDIIQNSYSMEKGFLIISKMIGLISHSEIVYHLVLSAGLLLLFFHVFKKKSNIFWLSIFLFVNLGDYYGSMNLFRQVLAAAILFCGFDLLEQRKYFKYVLIVIVATTIHTSALVMLIAYFGLISERNFYKSVGYVILIIVLWFLLNPIVDAIGKIFPQYYNYHYGMGAGSINAVWAIAAIYIFAIVSINYFASGYQRDNAYNLILLNGTFLCMVFLILGVRIYMFTRLAYFFRPFACLLVPNVLSYYEDKRTRNIAIVFIVIVCMLYTQITLSGTGYDPYYFYNGGV